MDTFYPSIDDEYIDPPAAGADDFGEAAASLWDYIKEGVSAIGDSDVASSVGLSYSGFGGVGNDPAVSGVAKGALDQGDKSWTDSLKNFWGEAMQEKGAKTKLIELGFGAALGMAKASAAKDAAEAQSKAQMDVINQRDSLEQAANKRFSESVSGLKPATPYKPKPLTRLDGQRVFTPGGLINQGVK